MLKKILLPLVLTYCVRVNAQLDPTRLLKTVVADWDGSLTPTTFTPIFADYNAAAAEDGLIAVLEQVSPLALNNTPSKGYHFQVSNRADDIFFGLKGQVTGLPKNANLQLAFDITIASSVGTGCVGIGGSPGDSVWLKVGATRTEPYTLYDSISGTWRLANANKGDQASSGPAGSVVATAGLAAADGSCGEPAAPFVVKQFTNHVHRDTRKASGGPYVVRSGADGSLWLLAGFDSGFEGFSSLYIIKLVARIYRA